MADQKISQLTAATTPLAGTEVFPIVQSGTTVKASISNVQTAPYAAGTANAVPYLNGSKVLTSGTALTFDGTNLGVGVTLEAWGSGQKAIQTPAGAIWNFNNANMSIVQNLFNDGSEKYVNTGFASAYNQNSGQHVWSSAPSGTAGTAATRTTTMSLDVAGDLTIAGATATKASGTTWANPSDQRLKDNIRDYEKGTAELMQIRVRNWEYNGKGGTTEGRKGFGVIADEAMLILPDSVQEYEAKLNAEDEQKTKIKQFDATEITWLLVKTVQQQQALIESLKARLDAANL